VRRSLLRAPAPLLVLLVVAVVEAVAWAVVLPPLQGPDEISHLAYVQRIVENHDIPWQPNGESGTPTSPYSTELGVASVETGVDELAGNVAARPQGTKLDERQWDATEARFGRAERRNGGFTSAMKNPPAYYLYSAVPYALSSGLGLFDQMFVLRLANIPLLLAMIVFTWLLAGELFGRRRGLQTLATAVVALQPQLVQLAAVINPDVALSAIFTAGLYLSVRVLRRGLTARRVAGLVALCALAGLTHGRGLALIAPVVAALALRLWRDRRPAGRHLGRGGIAAVAAAAVAAAGAFAYVATNGVLTSPSVRQLGSYLWQFYLPRLSFMNPIGPDYGIRDVLVERYYGGFAQLEVGFQPGVYDRLWVATLVGAILVVGRLVARRRTILKDWDVAVVLAIACIGLLALLHAVAYRSLAGGSGDPVIAGRYLLPLAALYGCAVAFVATWLPRRGCAALCGALAAGFCVVQVASLTTMFARFYA
jgi:4-amino-4-deoxy-L-arabinose transferase-like glycosyltransferase